MPLEAVMIAVDNSEYTRNGDYAPTRFAAQTEAVSYVVNAKLQENQESAVGLMTMAGTRMQVLVSPGRETGLILNALAKDVHIGGKCNFLGALKTAQLALKNRLNKNQRQRVILFVGSPLECDVAELVKLGKLFKKNNIAIDVVNFGTENTTNDNTEKLEQLVAAVNSSDNSHLVSIPPGPHIFADLVLTSSIMQAGGGGGGGGIAGVPSGGAAGAGSLGGVDPNMDPEMAMVLRMSMEEERQRQEKAAAEAGGAAAGSPAASAAGGAAMEEDEEALLAQAIALSMQENTDQPMSDASAASDAGAAAAPSSGVGAGSGASPAGEGGAAAAPSVASAADIDLAMQDPDFINQLLAGVPGAGGESVDNLLDELTGGSSAASSSDAAKEKKDDKKDAQK